MKHEDPQRFTTAQSAGLDARDTDRDRTLAAMHQLESALESAARGREGRWRDEVIGALSVLDQATSEESENASRPDSLLSDIARTQPRLRTRVRGVRRQYEHLRDRIESLLHELEESGDTDPDIPDLRERLGWLLTSLRHQRARESDLIYEAYYEAFRADLNEDQP